MTRSRRQAFQLASGGSNVVERHRLHVMPSKCTRCFETSDNALDTAYDARRLRESTMNFCETKTPRATGNALPLV